MTLTCTAVGAVLLCLGQSESQGDLFEHRALVSEHPQSHKLHLSGTSLRRNVHMFTDLRNSRVVDHPVLTFFRALTPTLTLAKKSVISKVAKIKIKSLLPPTQRKKRQRRCRRRCRKNHPGKSAVARKARGVCRKKCGNGDSGQYDDEPDLSPEDNTDTETAEDKEDDQETDTDDNDTHGDNDDAASDVSDSTTDTAGGVGAPATAPATDDPASPQIAHQVQAPEAPAPASPSPAFAVSPVAPESPSHKSPAPEAFAPLASAHLASTSPAPAVVPEAPAPESPAPAPFHAPAVVPEALAPETLSFSAPSQSPAPTVALDAPSPAPAVALEAPALEAPALEAPALEAPAIEAPVLEAPALEAPALQAPVLEAPAPRAVDDDDVDDVDRTTNALPVAHFKLQDYFTAYDTDRERCILLPSIIFSCLMSVILCTSFFLRHSQVSFQSCEVDYGKK